MYPRLYIARGLLREDGVIFISIDDNEVAQLRLLMDEIFGEENFVAELIWQKNFAPKNDNKYISISHEYILTFAKNKEFFKRILLPREEKHNKDYKNPDNDSRGVWTSGSILATTYSEKGVFEIIAPNGKKHYPPQGRCWRFSKEKIKELLEDNRLFFGLNGNNVPRIKRFLFEMPKGIVPQTLFFYNEVGSGQDGSQEVKKIFNNKLIFNFPKPTSLIKRILQISTNKDDIILDFFAGSGTTGDAVMQLNSEDGGDRKYILVQLDEPIDPKKNRTAYEFVKNELGVENPTIFEITKERLIRASKRIKENNLLNQNLDLGFKIFETTPIWENYNFEAEKLESTLELFDEDKLNEEDLKTLLITWKTYDGVVLTKDLEEIDFDGYRGYYTDGKLYFVDRGFNSDNLKELLEKIDIDRDFNPNLIVAFGYHFDSKNLREIGENIKSYSNKKNSDIDFVIRY
jgi:adenine-specific DNA-methyltransferase